MYAPIRGFPALDYGDPRLGVFQVPGTEVRLSLLREMAPLHLGLAKAWNDEVEKLDPKQCWGHAFRAVRGYTTTSYHAVGNAMDLNSSDHPLGVHPTFTDTQVAAARKVLQRFRFQDVPLYRWGYDYTGRKDDMHVEMIVSRDFALQAVAAYLTPPVLPPAVTRPKGVKFMLVTSGSGTVLVVGGNAFALKSGASATDLRKQLSEHPWELNLNDTALHGDLGSRILKETPRA